MPELVTPAEYARRRDCSRQAVAQAIAAGRITTVVENGKKMIDPEVADIQWARNTDQKQFERANAAKIAAATPPPPPSAGKTKAGEGGDNVYWDARARRETAEADKAEIELAKLRGDVADIEGMKRAAMVTGRLLRDSFLGLPAKLAPEYAGLTDAFEIERNMEAAIRRILDDIADLSVEDLTGPMQ